MQLYVWNMLFKIFLWYIRPLIDLFVFDRDMFLTAYICFKETLLLIPYFYSW